MWSYATSQTRSGRSGSQLRSFPRFHLLVAPGSRCPFALASSCATAQSRPWMVFERSTSHGGLRCVQRGSRSAETLYLSSIYRSYGTRGGRQAPTSSATSATQLKLQVDLPWRSATRPLQRATPCYTRAAGPRSMTNEVLRSIRRAGRAGRAGPGRPSPKTATLLIRNGPSAPLLSSQIFDFLDEAAWWKTSIAGPERGVRDHLIMQFCPSQRDVNRVAQALRQAF
jgi:hypothetical protein